MSCKGFDIHDVKNKIKEFVEKNAFLNNILTKGAEKTHMEKEMLFMAIVLVALLLIFLIVGGELIIDLVGFAYPMYASLKAIETPTTEDDKQWLTYWVVFSLFKVVEGVADFIVSSIPFYFLFKVSFLIWCYHPSSLGASWVYNTLIKPHVLPLLGLEEEIKVGQSRQEVSRLEVTLKTLDLTPLKRQATIFVEVLVRPDGRPAQGIENCAYKSKTVEGIETITFEQKIVLSPLTDESKSSSQLVFRVKEKSTFGEDNLLGERTTPIKSLDINKPENLIMTICGCDLDADVVFLK